MDSKILFFTRTLLYFLALIVPIFHPAIAVGHDLYTKVSLLFLLPLGMIFGYYFTLPKKSLIKGFLIYFLVNLITSFIAFPLNLGIFFPILIGFWGFFSTIIIFRGQGRFPIIATLEIFILAYIYYKILEYSRSSEEIAKVSKSITNIYIIITLISFLIHSIVLYIVNFSSKKLLDFKREIAILFVIFIPLFFIFALILPPDFIKHKIEFNELEPEPPLDLPEGESFFKEKNNKGAQEEPNTRNGKPLGKRKEKYPSELQNQKGGEGKSVKPKELEDFQGEGEENQKRKNKLEGVPSDMWDQFKNSQLGKTGKQMAVMIIASEIQPVFAAESYLTHFDTKKGFEIDSNEMLNELKDKHLISTWKDPEPPKDEKRSPYPIFYLSTIKERVLAYRPFSIEPTIMNKKYHPFNLSYTANSAISTSLPEDWKQLEIPKRNWIQTKYLEIKLEEPYNSQLRTYLNQILKNKNTSNYFDVIDSILQSYKNIQYKLGFNEETNIQTLTNFLFNTKEGDCTELSAITVILLRMSGIPARLVHGWIASRDLQTPAHIGGLIHLRKKIPYLQRFDLKNLYLVTTAHRHSWVQVYFPKYGWVDIETTAYTKPPKPEFDPNAQDVVIPLIEEEPIEKGEKFVFPYDLFFGLIGIFVVITFISLYVYKIFLNLYLILSTRKYSEVALMNLNYLFYLRLYEYGYPKRKLYETAFDYAEVVPQTIEFAKLFTELKFRTHISTEEKKLKYEKLKETYKKILNSLKPKSFKKIKFILNLKGIFFKL